MRNFYSCYLKTFILLIIILFSYHFAEAQSKKFRIYFKCVKKENPKPIDTLGVAYSKNLPFPGVEEKKLILSTSDVGKVQYLDIEALNFQLRFEFIYAEPGDTILYEIRPRNKVVFVYQDKELQDFENTKNDLFIKNRVPPYTYLAKAGNLSEYLAYCRQYRREEQQFIDSLFGKKKPILRSYLQEFSEYWSLTNMINGMRKLPLSSNDSLAFIEACRSSLKMDNPVSSTSNAGWRLFIGYYTELLSGTLQQSYDPVKFSKMQAAAKTHLSPATYSKFLLWTLHRFSNIAIPEYELIAKKVYGELSKMNFSAAEKILINKKYKEIIQMSKQLSYFNQIALKDINGKSLRLKQALQPKKLYLFDFWASWCIPCIEEIPALKKISEQYPDVQVISLSIDKNKEAWLKASKKFDVAPEGNYLVSELTRNELLDNYNIKDIPRFLLFDSKGKCITSNGPRPSDQNFEGFLKQNLSN